MMAGRRDVREIIREEPIHRREIQNALTDGGKTVPELAALLGYPSEELVYWVMGMRKYGFLTELPDVTEDGYYRYQVGPRGAI